MVDLGNLNAIIKRPNCDLCSLIALGCKQIWRGSPWGDESTGTTTKCYISKLDVSKQQTRGYALQISEFHADRPFQWVEFEIIFKGHDASLELVDSPFKAFPTVDFAFLKSALRNCEEKHDSCKAEASNTPEDMSAIDLENMSIVYAPKTADICSELCLGESIRKLVDTYSIQFRRFEPERLAGACKPTRTIRNAMHLCLELNDRYLWVDSLCIIQDDPLVQKHQIDITDTIYASAVLTIVAGAGDRANAGLPGVSTWLRTIQHQTITIKDIEVSIILPRLRDSADLSIWNTRG